MVTGRSRNSGNKSLLRRRASVIASILLPQQWHPSPYVVHLGQGVLNVATKSVLLNWHFYDASVRRTLEFV